MTQSKVFKIRLQKGDLVQVRSGKERGKTGKVIAVHPAINKVTVEGVNVVKRAVKPNRQYPRGGIIELTKPVWVSKVGLLDPAKKKVSRIGYQIGKDGKKTRVFKTSGKPVPAGKPEAKAVGRGK